MVESAKATKVAQDLNSPTLYINREISTLEYFYRVLEQSCEDRHPLLERVKFLAIFGSMLDEFFMVRVSDLEEEAREGPVFLAADGMSPARQLTEIRRIVTGLMERQRKILRDSLLPSLADEGIRILDYSELTATQRAGLRVYFERAIFPVLTPLAVDPGHPFPHISNLSLNLAVELAGDEHETRFARVKVPDVLPRLLHLESILDGNGRGKRLKSSFVWLDQVIAANLGALFPSVAVLASYEFRVIRDADIEYHEEEGLDLRVSVERGLRRRRFGEPVMLTVEESMPATIRDLLAEALELRSDQIYATTGPLGLTDLMQLTAIDRPDLKDPPLVPKIPAPLATGETIMSVLDRTDVLVYHPYDSFAPIIDLLDDAARDPDVLAIKQTLYRVGSDAPVVAALLDAVNEGKQVAVLVELKARWDEQSNIEWAQALEKAGVHVAYGFYGLKTHAKVALVVRKGLDGIRRYVHVGTGNYNVQTARAYTDLGLLTSDRDFGADATDLFNYLTGYSQQTEYRRFLVAPVNLRSGLLRRIEREIELHEKQGDGRLVFKMNSLIDREFIHALYRASQAGVRVDLIVRGMCSLRPGIGGISENIRVVSLVGRFLEHARAYWFHNGGEPELYLGSADLMPRNLDHRVEVLFPVLDRSLRDRVLHDILESQLRDNVNAWNEQPDGTYRRVLPDGKEPFNSQLWNIEHGL